MRSSTFLKGADKLQSREATLVAVLLALVFLANLSIASRSPFGGWMDEVFMADPGLNLAAGKGWVSSTWRYQTDREFWAQNSPLYPAGLSVWARGFGISMVSSRAYCYFLGVAGMFLFWLGTRRFNLLTPRYRLFWLLFLATAYSTNYMMRNQRYDVWIFVGLGLAWVGASLKRPAAKYGLIFLGCFLAPWAGFISMTYICLVAGVAALLTGFQRWKEATTAIAGAVAGMFAVLGFYALMGVLPAFWHMVQVLSAAGKHWRFPEALRVFCYPNRDYGIFAMIAALAGLTALYGRHKSSSYACWLGLGWGLIVLMPCIMVARGVFPSMYFYMLVVPLSLAILVLATWPGQNRCGQAVILLMGLLCLTGLPSRMYFSWREWDYRDPRHIREFVRTYVQREDCVYTDYLFYFELRDYVRWYAAPIYAEVIPADEAARVNVALVEDSEFPDLARDASPMRAIGGGWKKVAVFPTAEMRARLGFAPWNRGTYTLYRRNAAWP